MFTKFRISMMSLALVVSVDIAAQTYKTSDGLSFSVSVAPEKATIMLGETTLIAFKVTNLSDKQLYFGDGGDYRNDFGRRESYSVKVQDERGNAVLQPKTTFFGGGFYGVQHVPFEGSYVRRLLLSHWAIFDRPGTYFITVTRVLRIKGNDEGLLLFMDDHPRAEGVTTQTSTRIKIVPTEPEKLGRVIDEIGSRVVEPKPASGPFRSDAVYDVQLLDFIRDPRTIRFWIKALDVYCKKEDWDYAYVPIAIAKYDADEVMEALRKAGTSKIDQVRLRVADALGTSQYPAALPLLLSMEKDTYWLVRLRVLQAWSRIKSDEATSKIIQMLNDPHEDVRKYAAEYLAERQPK